tara:strand:+ start:238 stop:1413 length:1176 start_codon:yes stop_codon:yes gene_type:complete
MAITRLTDLVTVFEGKWVYGDVKFGYDGDVNQDHDTKYPLMLIQPPTSIMPVVYEGREEYEFEINFYNLYTQAAQSVVALQKRWDNLQDLANEWLDFILKNYQDSTVEAFLNDESIEIERVKDVANDKLVQIKLTFTMSGFTKCFRPTSNFPTDYTTLLGWFSADSLVTFDIPNKRVTTVGDRSEYPRTVNLIQSTTNKQPTRIGYDGINDKTYLSFDGVRQTLISDANLMDEGASDFTIFEVSKFGDVSETVFSYNYDTLAATIKIGLDSDDIYYANVIYGAQNQTATITNSTDIKGAAHIGVVRRRYDEGGSDFLKTLYYDANNQKTALVSAETIDARWNDEKFYVGSNEGTSLFLSGEFNELIVYNRALTDTEIDDIVGYLNYKYKIY